MAAASTSSPDKEPSVCPPGRAIFAVVVPPTELEPEDKRYALPRRAFPRGDATARRARVAPRLRARASRFPVRAARAAFKPATFGSPAFSFSFEARAAFPTRHRVAFPAPTPSSPRASPKKLFSKRRARIASSLQNMPPRYRVVERACGAVAFLGEGAPSPGAGPAFAPQVVANERCVLALVSRDVRASVVADAFRDACDAHADEPRLRALALKRHLCGLSEKGSAFSFVLLDASTARVFAATTALSSPVAAGHAADGTLLVTCTRAGAKAATAWPPRWAQGAPARAGAHTQAWGAKARETKTSASAFGASPPGVARAAVSAELLSKHASAAPSTPEREARPSSPASTERSRSRSPGASSTHSTGTEASEAAYQAAVTTRLQHLPAGRFVYGRRHLQPFEFSAFWGSAESTRAGARATSSAEGDRADASGRAGRDAGTDPEPRRAAAAKGEGARLPKGRPRFSDTGSRGDAASSWRKETPPAAPRAGAAAPESDSVGPRRDGWGRGDETVPAWGTSPSGARPGASPGTGTGTAAAPPPASFRAVLERSRLTEDSGSPTRGGLTRAFASSGLT